MIFVDTQRRSHLGRGTTNGKSCGQQCAQSCVEEYPGGLVKMRTLIQYVWMGPETPHV